MRTIIKLVLLALALCSAATLAEAQGPNKSAKAAASRTTIDAVTLTKFSPKARADLVAAIIAQWPTATAAGINTPDRIHHFIAQMATETGGFRSIDENLRYSAKRLLEIFPKRVTPAEAQLLAFKEVEIANHVYNNRFNNKPPMDGWNYRGSGLIQLTGRSNFADRGRELKMPLEEKPDLARTSPTAFNAAVAYWSARKINGAADDDDMIVVRKLVNGGRNGLKEANIWLARARQHIPVAGPRSKSAGDPKSDELAAMQDQLAELGFLPDKAKAAQDGSQVDDALKKFQESRGIPPTGLYDDDTLYELTDPGNFKEQ
jgi:putative chitinase